MEQSTTRLPHPAVVSAACSSAGSGVEKVRILVIKSDREDSV